MNILDDVFNGDEGNSYEAYEVANLVLRNPKAYPKHTVVAAKHVVAQHATKGYSMNAPLNVATPGRFAAQFDIVVTRNSSNLTSTSALPIALFCPSDAENGYRTFLTGLLPTGVALTSVRYGENASQPTALRYTFTDGGGVDTVDVTCNQYPYPAFLQAIRNGLFRVSQLRMRITNASAADQLTQGINYVRRSMFGATGANSMPVAAAFSPQQYQSTVIDIGGQWAVDSESGFQTAIIDINASFSVTYSMFVEKVDKLNAVNL